MKVFISGPMSGMPYENRAAFYKAQEELEKYGYSVWNPAWLAYPNNTEFTKDDMHIIDFAALRRCDAIYMLKGWKHSKGAQEEHEYAIMRGLMIMYEGVYCWGKEPVFDQEFAYDEAVKNRTNYQLEAIKENVKEKYNTLDKRIKSIEEELAWDKCKNDLPDNFCSNRIDSLEKWRNDFAECYTVNITNLRKEVKALKESVGTDNLQEQLEEVGDTVKGLNSIVATLGERNDVLSDDIYELQRIIISSDIENISIKAMNQKLIDLGRELDVYIDDYKEAYKHLNNADDALERRIKALENNRAALHEDCWTEIHRLSREIDKLNTAMDLCAKGNRIAINNALNDFNIRLKAIEKRLDIKPFYAPTEDEKDDD